MLSARSNNLVWTSRPGRELLLASTDPTSVTYLCTARSCTTPYFPRSNALISEPSCCSSSSVKFKSS